MKKRTIKNVILAQGCGVTVGFVVYYLLAQTSNLFRIYIAVAYYILALTLFLIGLSSEKKSCTVSSTTLRLFLLGIWLIALVGAGLGDKLAVDRAFLEWNKLDIFIWLHDFSVLLIVLFFSGFGVLNIIAKENNFESQRVLLAPFVGIFFLSIGTLVERIFLGEVRGISVNIIVFLNFILLLCFSYRWWLLRKYQFPISFKVYEILAMISLFSVVFLLQGLMNLPSHFVSGWDQWRHYSESLGMIDGKVFFGGRIIYLYFYTFLAGAIAGCNAPPANVFFMLSPIPLILMNIAFFMLSKTILDSRTSILSTTVFSVFSGLGGISYFLRLTSGLSYNQAFSIARRETHGLDLGLSGSFYGFLPAWLSFASILSLLVIAQKERNQEVRLLGSALLTFISYTFHPIECVMLILLVPILMMDQGLDAWFQVYTGIALGLGFSLIQYYLYVPITSETILTHPSLQILFLLFILIFFQFLVITIVNRERVARHWLLRVQTFVTIRLNSFLDQKRRRAISVLAIIVIFLLYLKWWQMRSVYDPSAVSMIPVPFQAVRFGIPLVLSVFSLLACGQSHTLDALKKPWTVLLTTILLANILEPLGSISGSLTLSGMGPRILLFSWLGISMLAGATMAGLFQTMSKISGSFCFDRKLNITVLLIFISIVGVSSNVVTVQRASSASWTPQSFFTFFSKLRSMSDPNGLILAPGCVRYIPESFSGRTILEENYDPLTINSDSPTQFLRYLDKTLYSKIGYHMEILIAPKSPPAIEQAITHSPGSRGMSRVSYPILHLTQYLPILFESQDFVAYKLPSRLTDSNMASSLLGFDRPPNYILKNSESMHILWDNATQFWDVGQRGDGNFSLSFRGGNKLDREITVEVKNGTFQRLALIHDFGSVDWSMFDSFSFSYFGNKTDSQTSVKFYTEGGQRYYPFSDTWLGWKNITIPISFMNSIDSPNLSKVQALEFRWFPTKKNCFQISNIHLTKALDDYLGKDLSEIVFPSELLYFAGLNFTPVSVYEFQTDVDATTIYLTSDPPDPPDELIKWIKSGGQLAIFSGTDTDPGFFSQTMNVSRLAKMCSITNKIVLDQKSIEFPPINLTGWTTRNPSTTRIGSYANNETIVSDFAITMKFGDGKVVLADLMSYFKELSKSSSTNKSRRLWSSGIEIMNLLVNNIHSGYINPPEKHAIQNEIKLISGIIKSDLLLIEPEVNTKFLYANIQEETGFRLEMRGDFTNSSYKGVQNCSTVQLTDVINLQMCINNVVLSSDFLTIHPSASDPYVRITSQGNTTLVLEGQSRAFLNLVLGSASKRLTLGLSNGTIYLDSPATFFIRAPHINAVSLKSELAYFEWGNRYHGEEGPISISDSLTFRIETTNSFAMSIIESPDDREINSQF